jgi:hypothetical protein
MYKMKGIIVSQAETPPGSIRPEISDLVYSCGIFKC